jgi:DNA invertase Pin-like site-specific DNA recombinase
MVAEFESDLIRMRTREGMAVAKAKCRLSGKKPNLAPAQEGHLVDLHRQGAHTTAEIAELFGAARSTVHRAIQRLEGVAATGLLRRALSSNEQGRCDGREQLPPQ